eukprot:5858136-Pyramimonas_sp.AAC.1
MTVPTPATPTLTVPSKPPWRATRSYRLCTLCAGAPQVAEMRAPGHAAALLAPAALVSDALLDPVELEPMHLDPG